MNLSLAQAVTPSPLLDPPTRAVLLMALLAFVVLALGLIAGALLGGRWARRMGGGDALRKPLPLRRAPGDASDVLDHESQLARAKRRRNRTGDTAEIEVATSETLAG